MKVLEVVRVKKKIDYVIYMDDIWVGYVFIFKFCINRFIGLF